MTPAAKHNIERRQRSDPGDRRDRDGRPPRRRSARDGGLAGTRPGACRSGRQPASRAPAWSSWSVTWTSRRPSTRLCLAWSACTRRPRWRCSCANGTARSWLRPGADEAAASRLQRWHRAGKKLIEGSGMAWTFVRPNGFMSNALVRAGGHDDSQGAVYGTGGDARLSVIRPARHRCGRDRGADRARPRGQSLRGDRPPGAN